MKDESKTVEETKTAAPEQPKDRFFGKFRIFNSQELKRCLVLLEKAASEGDFKACGVLTKEFKKLRKLFSLSDSVLVLSHYLPDLYTRLQLPCQPSPIDKDESVEDKLHCTHVRAEEITKHPEAQLFLYVLLLIKLIDDGDLKNVSAFSDFCRLRSLVTS